MPYCGRVLRDIPRISYVDPEEPAFDEYVFCEECADYVYEYCAIHGPLLVIPDAKVSHKPLIPAIVPRAALTIPRLFLHLARSIIPGAGIGVFSSELLPRGVRFGPYRGQRSLSPHSPYCWQIYDRERRRAHVLDASDAQRSNWMRYVNCARHWGEQNLVAFQYRGDLYYRTIKIIPRFTELLVFYGSEYATSLGVDLGAYNAPLGYAAKYGVTVFKSKLHTLQEKNISMKFEELDNKKIAKNIIANESNNEIKYNFNVNKNLSNFNSTDKLLNVGNLAHTDKKLHKCDVCEKCFGFRKSLKRHLRIHIGVKQFICDFCKKCFSEKTNLVTHLSTHTSNKKFKCDICSKCFIRKQYLNQHLYTHTGEKPYRCGVCHKCYCDKRSFKRHLRIHTGGKQFICDFCQKCFTERYILHQHLSTHTGEKRYKCDICHKYLHSKRYLTIHRQIHTGEKPYKCNICEKCFALKHYLDKHLNTHIAEKPYKCDICQKCLNSKHSLTIHRHLHTGEKPYKCNICEKSFALKQYLNQHLGTHTVQIV